MVWRCSSRVVGGGQQGGREAGVGGGVAAAGRGARHRVGPHPVAGPGDEQLGGGTHEPVDGEEVARRVRAAELAEHGAGAQRSVGDDVDGPGQHHLAGLAGLDAAGGLGHRLAPVGGGALGAQLVGGGPLVGRGEPGVAGEADRTGEPPGHDGLDLGGAWARRRRWRWWSPSGCRRRPDPRRCGARRARPAPWDRRRGRRAPPGRCRAGPPCRRPRWRRARRRPRRRRPVRPSGGVRCGRPPRRRRARCGRARTPRPSSPATARRSGSESRGGSGRRAPRAPRPVGRLTSPASCGWR